MYLSCILYVLNSILILVTDPCISWILLFVARVFISKADKAVKFVFQQLPLCHYLVM